jgi:hypothetical protein
MLYAEADEAFVIVVDGVGGDSGDFTLSLFLTENSCCTSQSTGNEGCAEPEIEECVCALEPSCCEFDSYLAECVEIAIESCGAMCPGCAEDGPACTDAAECSCLGCVDDGLCSDDEDCLCPDCEGLGFCECTSDGVCDPLTETCDCGDCWAQPSCWS